MKGSQKVGCYAKAMSHIKRFRRLSLADRHVGFSLYLYVLLYCIYCVEMYSNAILAYIEKAEPAHVHNLYNVGFTVAPQGVVHRSVFLFA